MSTRDKRAAYKLVAELITDYLDWLEPHEKETGLAFELLRMAAANARAAKPEEAHQQFTNGVHT